MVMNHAYTRDGISFTIATNEQTQEKLVWYAVMIQSFQTNRSGKTVQTQIRLLLDPDKGLHCTLLFHLHLFDELP